MTVKERVLLLLYWRLRGAGDMPKGPSESQAEAEARLFSLILGVALEAVLEALWEAEKDGVVHMGQNDELPRA